MFVRFFCASANYLCNVIKQTDEKPNIKPLQQNEFR